MILLTGGSGLLGTELKRIISLPVDAPSHREYDITKARLRGDYDLIIHAAAYTDVVRAEDDWENCLKINYESTVRLRMIYRDVPFVYISSEYAITRENYYSYTKWMGEQATRKYKPYLILRTLFKPRPFPWPKAFADQWTKGDYVDVIAELIVATIFDWDKEESKTVHVGTGRKTIFDLAKQTRPDVLPCSVDDVKDVKLPKDYL